MTAFTAYVLIPVYTFLFAINSDWFRTNFSVLGNIAGRKEAFVLWGLIVGIYFFFILRRIIRHMPRKPTASWLVYLALVLLDFAVTTPYLPEQMPLKASLHIVFAFLAAACLTICLFFIVLRLYQTAGTKKQNHLPVVSGRAGSHCADFRLSVCSGRNCQQRPGNLFYCFRYPYGLPAISAGLPPSISCCAFCSAFFFRRFRKKSESMAEQFLPEFQFSFPPGG